MTSPINRTVSTFETDENFNLRLDLDLPVASSQIPVWTQKRKSVCERVSDSVSAKVHSFVNAVSTSSIYQGVQEGTSLFSIAARNRLAHRLQRGRSVANTGLERVAEGSLKRQKRESTHSIAPPNLSPIEKLPKDLQGLVVQYLSPTNFAFISKKWAELLLSYYQYIAKSYRASPLVARYILYSGIKMEDGSPKLFIQKVWGKVIDCFLRELSIPSLHRSSIERAIQDGDFLKVFSEAIRTVGGINYEKATEFDLARSNRDTRNWKVEVEKFKKDLKERPRPDLIESIYGMGGLSLIAYRLTTLPDELRLFTNLESLWLDSNPKLDFDFLCSLPRLLRLGLRDCDLNDINFLSKLRNLRCLDLSNNPITDISEVAQLTDLKILRLNEIKKINIQHLIPLNDIEIFESAGSDYVNLDLIDQLPKAIRKEIESHMKKTTDNGKV